MLRADAFLSILLSNGEALLLEIKNFPLFFPTRAKQGKKELFMAAGLREMQGKSMGFRDSDRQTGIVASFILLFKIANYSID